MAKFLCKMYLQPLYCYVEAEDKEKALDEAVNNDIWETFNGYGGETYEVEEVK